MSGVTKEGEKRDDGFLILFFLKTQNEDIIFACRYLLQLH